MYSPQQLSNDQIVSHSASQSHSETEIVTFQAKDEPVTTQPGASPSHKSPSESSPLAGATGPPSYDSVFPTEAKETV